MQRWSLIPMRVAVGLTFVMHGWLKLFGMHLAGTAQFFQQVGVPLPHVAAPAVTALEILGGLAVMVGVYARWAALLLAFDMAGAIVFAKLHGGFFAPRGMELELLLLACALTLALGGSGALSLDRILARRG